MWGFVPKALKVTVLTALNPISGFGHLDFLLVFPLD
jgi:hypothetical protein